MPGFLLHFGAQVTCLHNGLATPTVVNPRVTVSGQPVVMLGAPYTVAMCALPPPIAANGPCATAQFITGATRVFSGGLPVLVFSSQAICVPTGTPLLVLAAQPRVTGV
ncbi:MAG TPA: hypothetical protein VE959_33590 [Bryobacteraceae bacterium]|nr:hypothetical protein [Bryobacteraceae bacterium]